MPLIDDAKSSPLEKKLLNQNNNPLLKKWKTFIFFLYFLKNVSICLPIYFFIFSKKCVYCLLSTVYPYIFFLYFLKIASTVYCLPIYFFIFSKKCVYCLLSTVYLSTVNFSTYMSTCILPIYFMHIPIYFRITYFNLAEGFRKVSRACRMCFSFRAVW